MPALHLEEVPSDLYERLEQLALARQQSVPAEAVRLLQQAVQQAEEAPRVAHAQALADLRRHRWTPPPGTPDSVTLLREARER